ncbi:MAG: hypothetical protein KDA27_14010 [Candidatus Eisenbacteria bacterium]|uniref:Uncharacterized protein n=1 Tax=Eiseniibacteriota bacterium TaxID=2212470 RepID=A0A956NGC6_UNCEI|nr:hypothetical protein [Candidatus Eisenbacteria bacterium]MCB9465670.1 hypothetical protein [Candidatus Eisenbacteria bacterium]
MNVVEKEYRARLGRLSGKERVALATDLHAELCLMIRRRILAAQPDISERVLQLRVAQAVYRTDPGALRLLSLIDESDSHE